MSNLPNFNPSKYTCYTVLNEMSGTLPFSFSHHYFSVLVSQLFRLLAVPSLYQRVSAFTGLDHWNGLLDWNTGLYKSCLFSLLPKLIPVIIIVHLDHANFII